MFIDRKYLNDLKVSNKRELVFDNKIKQVIIRNTKHRTLPEVVKLVDAADSKSAVRDDVSVRVRPSGPFDSLIEFCKAPSLIYQWLGALSFLAVMFFYGIFWYSYTRYTQIFDMGNKCIRLFIKQN